jgi:hypothetical protein
VSAGQFRSARRATQAPGPQGRLVGATARRDAVAPRALFHQTARFGPRLDGIGQGKTGRLRYGRQKFLPKHLEVPRAGKGSNPGEGLPGRLAPHIRHQFPDHRPHQGGAVPGFRRKPDVPDERPGRRERDGGNVRVHALAIAPDRNDAALLGRRYHVGAPRPL